MAKVSSMPTPLAEYLSDEEQPKPSQTNTTTKGQSKPEKMKPKRSTTPQKPVREGTFGNSKRQQIERNEELFDNWQQVKQDQRLDKTKHNRKKITLQQELIKSQDALLEERVKLREEEQKQKRVEEKAARKAKSDALQDIGRESLKQDKLNRYQRRHGGKGQSTVASTTSSAGPRRRQVSTAGSSVYGSGGSDIEDHEPTLISEMYQTSSQHHIQRSPQSNMLLEEDEEGEEEEQDDADVTREDIPWHHAQLYSMYGKQADYFLYPKMEQPEKVKITKPMNPRLKKDGSRMGARMLWSTLRHDSRMKLIDQDENIKPELKAAYSAFVRQCLARRKRPVKRNFYSSEDVPEMEKLLDQSKVLNAQDYRHKMEIMFRASNVNEDRTRVLMFNNPMPNLNNKTGDESVDRYMPSWVYDEDLDLYSEASYKKWLKARESGELGDAPDSQALSASPPAIKDAPQTDQEELGLDLDAIQGGGDEWDFLNVNSGMGSHTPSRRKKVDNKPKYLFLTERQARCEGQFSLRHREQAEAKNIPKAYDGKKEEFKSHSAMAMVAEGDGASSSRSSLNTDLSFGSQSDTSHRSRKWQPLSLNALIEYSEKKHGVGEGVYRQGREPVWSLAKAQTVS